MKKLALSIISLTGILALTGCGETTTYKPVVVEEKHVPSQIFVSEPGLVMFTGDTAQLNVHVRPLVASDAELVYVSSNKRVATVSSEGLVTAKGAGAAVITVYAKEDPSVYETVSVGVEKNVITATEGDELDNQRKALTDKFNTQKNVQKANYSQSGQSTVEKVYIRNGIYSNITRDGKHFQSDILRQDFTVSIPDGFFGFEYQEMEARSPEGNPGFESGAYYFFCNEDFDAHAYKRSDTTGKRADIDAQDFIGKSSRIEVIYLLLDNIFTSQRKIATNQFDDALESGQLSSSNAYKAGYSKNGETSIGVYKYNAPSQQTISKNEEDDLDIPAGTKIMYSTSKAVHWNKGRVNSSQSTSKMEYDIDGHHYVRTEESFVSVALNDEFEVVYPDKDLYQKVATFIDIF